MATAKNYPGLKGKVAIVSGGSRGIGRAIVKELVNQGAAVMFTFLKQRALADELVDQLKYCDGKAVALQADVRELNRAKEIVAEAIKQFGHLDALVNNAGITRDKAFMLMEPMDWQEVIDTNLTGTFNSCRAAIVTFMKQRHGRIINITSVAGLMGSPRQANYAASKAGIIGLTRALAKEVAPYNVTVNAVAPGYVETDMTATIAEKHGGELKRQIPLGRLGHPEEVAGLVATLLGDPANYITGQVIAMDGGLSL